MTSKGKSKWNICLLLCCLAAALASYQFGYNIGALNTPMPLVKQFVKADLFLFEEFYSVRYLGRAFKSNKKSNKCIGCNYQRKVNS